MCVLWTVICAATVMFSQKRYLPKLRKDVLEEGKSEANTVEVRRGHVIIIAMLVIGAAACGVLVGRREYAWPDVLRLLVAQSVLTTITLTDIELYRIPNACVLVLVFGRTIATVTELLFGIPFWGQRLLADVVGGVIILLCMLIVAKVAGGGLGYGDVKLLGGLTLLLGIRRAIYILLFSFFLCALFSAVLLFAKKKGLKDDLPLGPFIWLGFITTIFVGVC